MVERRAALGHMSEDYQAKGVKARLVSEIVEMRDTLKADELSMQSKTRVLRLAMVP